jgi:hypothetical protein
MGFSSIRHAVMDLAAGVLELHDAGRKADKEVHNIEDGFLGLLGRASPLQ